MDILVIWLNIRCFAADKPENGGAGLLLSNDFLRYCVDMFSIPKGVDLNSRTFSRKHLNIIDPLKENNNLGRSVSKGRMLQKLIVGFLTHI